MLTMIDSELEYNYTQTTIGIDKENQYVFQPSQQLNIKFSLNEEAQGVVTVQHWS